MHLVFLNQYYPPDAAPTGVMLAGVVAGLLRDGHEVTILCAAGGYAGKTQDNKTQDAREEADENSNIEDLIGSNRPAGPRHDAQATSPVPDLPAARIIRIGATRFGRASSLGKLLDYASYYLGVGWKLLTLRPAPERIVALTTPPYLSVLARLMSKLRGAGHAHWVMDLYPDVMAAHGMLDERRWPYRLLARLARWGSGGSRCAALLTLGPDMAERLGKTQDNKTQAPRPTGKRQRHTPIQVQWVPLWGTDCASGSVEEPSAPDATAPVPTIGDPRSTTVALALRRARGWGDEDLVVMYSGNMGLGHRFGEILAAAGQGLRIEDRGLRIGSASAAASSIAAPLSLLSDPRSTLSAPRAPAVGPQVRFVFFGGGKRRDEVASFARDHPQAGIELYDYAPADQLAAHLQSAEVHLASLDPAWTGTMVPSKLQGIFAAGRPVIFIGSAESSIGRWVHESGGGWVVAAGDVAGVAAALAEASDPAQRAMRGRAAKGFAATHFDQRRNVARVVAVLTA
jgi:hypothetical protein